MLILISPAKTMKENRIHKPRALPSLTAEAQILRHELLPFDIEQIMKLMKVNEKIAASTRQRYEDMKFDLEGFSALDSYDGTQFKAMNLDTCPHDTWQYLDQHLRILSGFYGIVRPNDSIYPYRLEMQTKLAVQDSTDLYTYWSSLLADEILTQLSEHKECYILNLASKEYDKCIRSYIKKEIFIDIDFYEQKENRLRMHSTQAKKARGEMVRYLADHKIERLEDVKHFHVSNYRFKEALSDDTHLVFVKELSNI